jgi:hypothetical protein
MSYANRTVLRRSVGSLSGINDKVDRGDEVTLRFQPGAGVNASTGQRVIDALRTGVLGTRHFETPSVASWGSGTNRGMLVIKAETRSDNYTLQQIANFMPNIARNASASSGLPVTFASAKNEDGDEAFAAGSRGQSSGGGSSALPMMAQIIDIRVLSATNRALAQAMSTELARRMREIQVGNYDGLLNSIRSLATRSLTDSAPITAVRDAVYYGIRQLDRLSTATERAVDKTLRDRRDPGSFVDTPKNREIIAESQRGLGLADRIRDGLSAIYRAVAPAEGVRGLGDLSSALYTMSLGLLFSGLTGGVSVPVAMLVALTQLFGLVDEVIEALKAMANVVVEPVQEAAADWLRFVLIGGTVAAAGYIGWKLWITKRAASRFV